MNNSCAKCGKALSKHSDRKLCVECEGNLAANLLAPDDESTLVEPSDGARMIAHYKIVAKLGEGGMGQVFRATDTKLGREVAIKLLPEGLSGSSTLLARFQREAKVLASLNHPNIATIHGIEDCDGSKAIVMELVEGETLSDRLKRGPMTMDEALSVFHQIAAALEAAHEKGVIHRDLKPGNINFTADGKVKVLDFGLAKAIDAKPGAETENETPTLPSEMTMPGAVMGTPAYMSPEQTRGESVDKRTDVWAFGCCLFESLTGRKPFQARTISDMMAEVLKSDPDFTIVPPETPQEVMMLLRRCLEKEPRRRLRDLGDIAIRLEESVEVSRFGASTPKTATPRPENPTKPGLFRWLVMALIGALMGAGLFAVLQPLLRSKEASAEPIGSLAVLSFMNRSGDQEYDWLVDTLADATHAKLSGLEGILVRRARMDPESFSPSSRRALELNVDAYVTGYFVHHAGQLQVTVNLIHGREEISLGTLIRPSTDVFAMQDDVALTIAKQIRANVTERDMLSASALAGINPEAYREWRKGLRYFNSESMERAVGGDAHFRRALELDPGFGDPVGKLAGGEIIRSLADGDTETINAAMERAEAIISQYAAEVRNPEDYADTQGYLALLRHDWAEGKRLLSLGLDSPYERSENLVEYGSYYLSFVAARHREGIEHIEAGLEEDPENVRLLGALAEAKGNMGDHAEAVRILEDVLEKNPRAGRIRLRLARSLSLQGEHDRAIREIDKLGTGLDGGRPRQVRAILNARAGNVAEARSDLATAELRIGAPPQGILAAIAYAYLGDLERTYSILNPETLPDLRDHDFGILRTPPVISLLGEDVRYWRAIDALRLPPLPIDHPSYETEQRLRFGARKEGALIAGNQSSAIRSLAILPFDDLKPEEDFGWLSDAMADAVRQKLGSVRDIVVKRGQIPLKELTTLGHTVQDAARRLNVDALVQGNFVHHQGELRVNVSLYDGRDGVDQPLGQFAKNASGVFELQSDVALAIAERVRSNLDIDEKAAIARSRGIDPAAYEAYRKGLTHYLTFSETGYQESEKLFKRALALDPGYGHPVARLGNIPWLRTTMEISNRSPAEGIKESRAILGQYEAAVRDPKDLLRLKAWIAAIGDRDWVTAEKLFRELRELGGGMDDGAYGRYLAFIEGRYKEAIVMYAEELELEPTRFDLLLIKSEAYMMAGSYADALETAELNVRHNPSSFRALVLQLNAMKQLGRGAEAASLLRQLLENELNRDELPLMASYLPALLEGGEGAVKALAAIDELEGNYYLDHASLAHYEARLGRVDEALTRLEKAVNSKGGMGVWYSRSANMIETLGHDPRYWRAIDQLNLPALPVYHPYYDLEQERRFGKGKNELPETIRSIAILPFDDLKPDEEYGWLSDAMADAIRDKLDTLDGMSVRRAHLTLKQLVTDGKSIHDVARNLDVDAFVQGNFLHHHGELRMRVSLYSGATGLDQPLGSFKKETAQVFELQDTVALAIAERIRSDLREDERAAIAKSHGIDPEAYRLYRLGREAFYLYTPEGFDRAQSLTLSAVEKDPGYGKAVAQLALVPWTRTIWGGSNAGSVEGVVTAVDRLNRLGGAVRDKESLLRAKSWIAAADDRDWVQAEKLFRGYYDSLNGRDGGNYAFYLTMVEGRGVEAARLIDEQLTLEPHAIDLRVGKIMAYHYAGMYQECLDASEPLLERIPEHWDTLIKRAIALLSLNRISEAIEASEVAVEKSGQHPVARSVWALIQAKAGFAEEAKRELAALDNMEGIQLNQGAPALIEAALGDYEACIRRWESAIAVRGAFEPMMLRQAICSEWLGHEPGYWRLVDQLKLPPLPVYHPHYALEQEMRFGDEDAQKAPSIRSLAVLPFDDLKPDEEFGWLSDAMADAVRQKLGNLKGVTVKRGHMPFKGFIQAGLSAAETTRQLDVDAVVQGNFVHHQGEIRVNVSLYQGHDGQDRPLGQFSEPKERVFELQNDVALAIADRVRSNLNEEERAAIARSQGIDPAAYEACRKGLMHYFTYSNDGYDKAESYFNRAIALDPGYGEPVTRLGNIPWLRTAFGFSAQTPKEAIVDSKATLAAHESVVQDPEDLLRLKGWIACYGDWDWVNAEKHLRRVRKRANNLDDGSYGRFLYLIEGRYLEALQQFDDELELGPKRFDLFMSKTDCHLSAGFYGNALEVANAAIETYPNAAWPKSWRAWALAGMGRQTEAVSATDDALALAPDSPGVIVYSIVALALSGEVDRVNQMIETLDRTAESQFIEHGFIMLAEAALGRTERALGRLEKVVETGAGFGAFYARRALAIDVLGEDPRYWSFIDQLDLPALPIYHKDYELERRMRFGRK
jgi:serine/threonine protein kinase/TolB-like protein/predicted Zn-dependent protease